MLIQDKNLFPLILISQNIGTNYFLDDKDQVWSNRGGALVQLRGSRTKSGTYFKFGQQWGSGWRHDSIVKLARAHKQYREHLYPTGTIDPKAKVAEKSTTPRHHAENVEQGITARGSIIGRVHKGHLVFGSEPTIHTTEQSVKDEMTRLAAKYPGVKFVRCRIDSAVVSGGVQWS